MRTAITPVVHLELHTGDLRQARGFYSDLCGRRPERGDTGSRAHPTPAPGGGPRGGRGASAPSTITTNLPGAESTASNASTPATSTPAGTGATTGATTSTPAAGSTTGTTATTQGTRVPAVFTLKGGSVTPKTVSVP